MNLSEFEGLFDLCQDVIIIVDRVFSLVAANEALSLHSGLKRSDMLGSHIEMLTGREFFSTELKPRFDQCFAGELVNHDGWFSFPGLGERFMNIRYSPHKNEQGEIVGAVVISRDITEQKKLEEALELQHQRLDTIVSSLGIGLMLINKDRTIDWVNERIRQDFPNEEPVGCLCYQFFEVYHEQCRNCIAERTFLTGETGQVERFDSKTGRWYSILTEAVRDSEGNVVQVLQHLENITERKKAEEVIHQSEQRFRNIFETVQMIAVQGYDENHRVVYWNPASEFLYGFRAEEALGNRLEDLIIPEPMREGVWQGIEAWMNDGIAIPAGELDLQHKDGTTVSVHSSHVMQETPSGEKFMYCIDVDLSEAKRIHSQLVKAKEKAEEASLAKSEFLANMSHEIRTPLNGIMGMFSLMKSAELDVVQEEYAQAGLESARRLNRLLGDILDLSKVEAGKLGIQSEMFDLSKVIHQVDDFFRYTSLNAEEMLECRLDERIPQFVVGDAARLQQVLTNLVGNGLKFTPSGKVELDVSLTQPVTDGQCRLLFSVSDTGIGIPDHALQTLFDPFTQVSTGFNRQYEGAGLGLAICRRIVKIMGGNMSIASEEGVGTKVHMVIPFEVGKQEPVEAVTKRVVATCAGLNVLLVEDERVNTVVARRMLEKIGCRVDCVGNGKLALELAKEKDFDTIFMDVQMPVMDGIEATKQLRAGGGGEYNKTIPIIAMTAHAMVGDRERFLASGMDDYISKPVDIEDLQAVLERLQKN